MKRPKKLMLTDRDFLTFYYLFSYKVMTTKQVWKYPFKGKANINNVRKRIKRYLDHDLIKARAIVFEGVMQRIFSLTPKGLQELKDHRGLELHRNQLESNSIIHDLNLVEIGERLKGHSEVINYFTENEIQCLYEDDSEHEWPKILNSDGFLELKRGHTIFNIAVEYEHSSNSKAKYRCLVEDYYYPDQINIVLFLYRKDWIKKAILQKENEDYSNCIPRFYFLKIGSDNIDLERVIFENRKAQKLTFNKDKFK